MLQDTQVWRQAAPGQQDSCLLRSTLLPVLTACPERILRGASSSAGRSGSRHSSSAFFFVFAGKATGYALLDLGLSRAYARQHIWKRTVSPDNADNSDTLRCSAACCRT
ncbi:MAG: hypothetical protein CBARDCOR_2997 [uncultured Caballeronia sp.]|nr:MAG: hypothetical protein CBARDCOR_2997 [uncultured Caballeronia sp.]